jgi:hypothetical protein
MKPDDAPVQPATSSSRLPRRTAIALIAAAPMGCRSPNPALYTLAVIPGAEHTGAPRVIELRAVAVAHYLERSQIVRSSEDFRLDVIGNDWWGEPLDAMLGRVLSQELTQRLPGSMVYGENGALTTTADTAVAINVQKLDADHTGSVVPDTAALVSAMSSAVAQLADTIAAMLSSWRRKRA